MAGAMECAARVLVHRWGSQPGAIRDPLLRYHPTLGWDKPPGAEGWIRRPEYNVHLQINARGLRGPDRDYAKPRGVHRTLLLGDSFTEGYTVAEEETVRALDGRGTRGGRPADRPAPPAAGAGLPSLTVPEYGRRSRKGARRAGHSPSKPMN